MVDPAARVRSAPGWLLPALCLLFFFSGASALVYQILWLRLLALVFGVTVYAASTVLASFMAGLALGSLVAGRLADRVRHPLAWFGAVEALVGMTALATPGMLQGLEQVYVALYQSVGDHVVVLTLARFLCSFAVLVVPTTLMGATLPLVVKSSLARLEGLGERVGVLYAANTAGAVAGTLASGLYLVGRIGISATFTVAATLNFTVAGLAVAGALALGRRDAARIEGDVLAAVPRAADDPIEPAASRRVRRLVLLIFTLSGFTGLALEVVWFRTLVLYLRPTVYAFTLMLAAVLTGIAAGSAAVAPLMRRRLNWVAVLAGLELARAVATVSSFALLARAYDLLAAEPLSARPFLDQLAPFVAIALLAILPATLLMGAAFPIGMHVWAGGHGDARGAADRVGIFYSLNVCGAILGSIAAGFLLLPRLGSRPSLVALALVSVASGLALLTQLDRARRRRTIAAALGAIAIFALAASRVPNPIDPLMARRYPRERVVWRAEDAHATVAVHLQAANRSLQKVLYIDGLHQADDAPGLATYHRVIGLLPMALHPGPERALIIGLGGGATPGAVAELGVPVEVIELSGAVVRAAAEFRHINGDVLRRPNVRLAVADGRNHLLLTTTRYDVVTADIIRPFHAGGGNLYAAEYFALVKNALDEDGLACQWIETGMETYYTLIMRTFLSVFPHATLWANGSLMIGSKHPLQIDRAAFERKLRDPLWRAALASVGLPSFDALLASFTAGPEELRRFVGSGPILTDDRPLLEYFFTLPRNDRLVDPRALRGDVRPYVR